MPGPCDAFPALKEPYLAWHNRGVWPTPAVTQAQAYAGEAASLGARALYERWQAGMEECKFLLATLCGADPGQIAWAANTSTALGLMAWGWPLKAGDEVLIGASEYPSTHLVFAQAAKERGFSVRLLPPDASGHYPADQALAAITPQTRLLVLSLVVLQTGERIAIEDIQAGLPDTCRLLVDGVQGIGQTTFSMKDCGAAAVAGDLRKWLLGPDGGGFLLLHPETLETLQPVLPGPAALHGYQVGSFDPEAPVVWHRDARKLEGGALSSFAAVVARASLGWRLGQNPDHWYRRREALSRYLETGLDQLGLSPLAPPTPSRRSCLVGLAHRRAPQALQAALDARRVFAKVAGGALRFSFFDPNTEEDLQALLDTLKTVPEV